MNELLSAAVPLIGLVCFLALVYWPEVRPALGRLHFAPIAPILQPVRPAKPVAVVPVRRRVRRSVAPKSAVRRERSKMRVRGIEQPRTALSNIAIETQRIEIAKRLRDAGVAETVVIECVWGVTRGGGKRFIEAREAFRQEVSNPTDVVEAA